MAKNRKTNSQSSGAIVERDPKWLCFEENSGWSRSTVLFDILFFFVVCSPCSQYCTHGMNLQHYGWKKKPWQSNRYLKQKLLSAFSTSNPLIKTTNNLEEIPGALIKAKLDSDYFYADIAEERIAVYLSESSEFMSIFYHIRCALAHGRFAVKYHDNEPVFIMENGVSSGNGFLVKARMIIYKKTLDKWIKIITSGPQEDEPDYRKDIINQIIKDKHTTIKKIAAFFNETEYIINKHLNLLKEEGIVRYQNRGKNGYWEIDYAQKEKFDLSKIIMSAQEIA